jgi:hypothetical protein
MTKSSKIDNVANASHICSTNEEIPLEEIRIEPERNVNETIVLNLDLNKEDSKTNQKCCNEGCKSKYFHGIFSELFDYTDWNYNQLKESLNFKINVCKWITLYVIIASIISALPLFKIKIAVYIKISIIYFSAWTLIFLLVICVQLGMMMKRAKKIIKDFQQEQN